MRYATVAVHRSMALDAVRNAAYDAALAEAVTPESVVLDLGAGTGVHGLLAARHGARRVFLVEPEDIITVAADVAAMNGLADRVECFQGRIQDVTLPEPVDVIVSVLTGNLLLTEDLLEILFWARDHVLKPGGTLIPSAAEIEAVPVFAPEVHHKYVSAWSEGSGGIDLGAARQYAANTVHCDSDLLRSARPLAAPASLYALDFHQGTCTGMHGEATYTVAETGLCHGWAGWFRMKLGRRWLSTSPYAPALHWSPVFLPVDPPVALTKDEQITFVLDRRPHGDWTWSMETAAGRRRHSTFFAVPIGTATLEKASPSHQPALNREGSALAFVLSRFDGGSNVQAIAEALQSTFPDRFSTPVAARGFALQAVQRYT